MKKISAHMSGFTIIELMIVVTIMVIVAGMSFVSVISFTQTQGTADDAKTFVSEMRRVYSEAVGVFYPNTCTGLTGYTVKTGTPKATDITVTANCSAPGPIAEQRLGVLKSSKFSGVVTFTFNVPDGVVSGSPQTVQINNANDPSNHKIIKVSSNGVFNIQ